MYYLYKLTFPKGVHFGADKKGIGLEKISMNCHSDTFYSALCLEILNLYGENELNNFIEITKKGEFLISDLMPYKSDELYVPKPVIYIEKETDGSTDSNSTIKKKMKKLNYIPISELSNYFNFLKTGGKFPEFDTDFGKTAVYEKVQISRSGIDEDNRLYSFGTYYFKDDCGLYFIAKFDNNKKDWFEKILCSLSYSGIGGKRSLGYGLFEFKEISNKKLDELLNNTAEFYLTLSLFYPKTDEINEIKEGFYTLINRQGYIYSATYADDFYKKVPIVMLNTGSCFKKRLTGDVVDVSNYGKHPVYRYGKPIMIGINL